MRNLKKLFAVVVVIAVMITTMIPAAFAEGTTALSADAQACATLGMLQGSGNGVTYAYTQTQPARIQAAIMLIRLKGLDAAAQATPATADNFSDVTATWMKPYTAYLKAHPELGFAGIGNNKFDPNTLIDAKQYYSVMLTVLGYSGDYSWSTVMSKAASIGLTKNLDNTKFTVNDLAVATVEALKTAVKGSEKTLIAKMVEDKVISSAIATQSGVYTTPVVGDLAATVTALNSKQFQIVFNKEVDSTTLGSVVVTQQGSANAPGSLTRDLSTDGKTLTITTANTLTNTGYYRVDVTGVQDTLKNTITPYSTVIQVNDKTAPSIESTNGTTNVSSTRTFKVTFSEPVQLDLVKVGTVVASATPDAYFKTYTITLPGTADALIAGQSYALTINGLRDFAGNYAATSVAGSVAIVQDTVKPTFTLSSSSPVDFTAVFSKEMNTTIPVDGIVITNANGAVLPLAAIPSLGTDKKTLSFKLLVSPIAADKTSAIVTVKVQNLKDSVGNVVDTKSTDVTVTKSSTLPTITAARIVPGSNTQIEVTFNESVIGLANTDFALTRNGDSTHTDLTVTSVGTLDSNNRVILTVPALTVTDTYTIALKVNSVTDASGNTNAAVVQTFTYTAAAPTQLTATIYGQYDATPGDLTSSTHKAIYIAFSASDVKSGIDPTTGSYVDGAADNPANYTLDGAPLPQGATVTFTNATPDSVIINLAGVAAANLPSEFANGGSAVVTVSNVKNVAGSTVQYTSNQITVLDGSAPTISAAYLTGNSTAGYTITLAMSEKIGATALGDFVINVNGTPVVADSAIVSTSDATKIIITITTNKAAVTANTGLVTIETVGGTLTTADQATPANLLANIAHVNAINVLDYHN